MISLAMLRSISTYRGFILGNVKREFQIKYRNSLLGALWNVLNPLSMIVVYTVIFAQVMHNRLAGSDSQFSYSIYLCAGVLTWGLFVEIISRGQGVFIENANLIKKISFPRICLPIIVVLNALLNFGIIFSLFTGFLIVSGNFPGWVFIAMFPLLAILVVFAIGLAIVIGVLNVFFRDVGQFFNIFIQFWFWFTPVVYPETILPEAVRPWMHLNPMAALVSAFHKVLVDAQWPDWQSLLPATMAGLILCGLGMHLFRKRVGEMVDEL